ncbi:tetrahydromethanopterin S-methyltransferase, subunit C [Methanocaldococcus vulcanius M7]|uniref:Tetrahydromethanopterin S-methyltransferase subunit C n=1 Tax=Methanocaldococcus vulcanius (strain ATCC 700851 / DSM 12094 / M7) TaxID=579137 RepID=C9REL8_METVM|nr:tetrahydromethanopterin S-methyltransferase subunit C [Methanocaldococcus vulcanius]ACX72020.1 tetrahydromethanopterin S-methyltransferase, subunit C [Methanocaldococcus vulcanius M7]
MSHGGGGHASELYPEEQIFAVGIALAFIGCYLANFLAPYGLGMLLGGLFASAACVAGANTVRKVAAYGLGTGVPSIGMVSLGMGTLAAVAGILIPDYFNLPYLVAPVITLIVSAVIGYVVGKLTVNPVGMKIPIMVRSMTFLSIAGAMALLGFTIAYVGSMEPRAYIDGALNNGLMALAFIAAGMAILHPFNACLGPNESHKRTLTLAVACGLLTWFIFSAVRLDLISMIVSIVLWAIVYVKFVKMSLKDACAVLHVPEIPKKEEE